MNSNIQPWPYHELESSKIVRTENARLFKGESKKIIVRPLPQGLSRISNIFWHSDTGHPIFISQKKQKVFDDQLRGDWEVTVHNPFGDDVYVELTGIQEGDSVWVDVDTIGDPEPFAIGLHNIKTSHAPSKKEFWKVINLPVPVQSPIVLEPFQTSGSIIIQPSKSIGRRIRDIYWISDLENALVLQGMQKRDIANNQWEIMLHNASNKRIKVDVFGIEEEYVGKITSNTLEES
ncbi:hypothetical protein COJ27_26045 [Bacillus cereus]|uniref:hypothetical protein n=1 Tax=Bacillus cereus TaxID=1396 RepID=UPI000BF5E9FE|nr:hypothetical protein [Bacillus cereus]PFL58911.1 hypothetical protein COJ27_26045 [Bacillus cereus]